MAYTPYFDTSQYTGGIPVDPATAAYSRYLPPTRPSMPPADAIANQPVQPMPPETVQPVGSVRPVMPASVQSAVEPVSAQLPEIAYPNEQEAIRAARLQGFASALMNFGGTLVAGGLGGGQAAAIANNPNLPTQAYNRVIGEYQIGQNAVQRLVAARQAAEQQRIRQEQLKAQQALMKRKTELEDAAATRQESEYRFKEAEQARTVEERDPNSPINIEMRNRLKTAYPGLVNRLGPEAFDALTMANAKSDMALSNAIEDIRQKEREPFELRKAGLMGGMNAMPPEVQANRVQNGLLSAIPENMRDRYPNEVAVVSAVVPDAKGNYDPQVLGVATKAVQRAQEETVEGVKGYNKELTAQGVRPVWAMVANVKDAMDKYKEKYQGRVPGVGMDAVFADMLGEKAGKLVLSADAKDFQARVKKLEDALLRQASGAGTGAKEAEKFAAILQSHAWNTATDLENGLAAIQEYLTRLDDGIRQSYPQNTLVYYDRSGGTRPWVTGQTEMPTERKSVRYPKNFEPLP